MIGLKRKEAKREKQDLEMYELLRKSELLFIRGGDQGNTEKDGDQ